MTKNIKTSQQKLGFGVGKKILISLKEYPKGTERKRVEKYSKDPVLRGREVEKRTHGGKKQHT